MSRRHQASAAAFLLAFMVLVAGALLVTGATRPHLTALWTWTVESLTAGPAHVIRSTYRIGPGRTLTIRAAASNVTIRVVPSRLTVGLVARLYGAQSLVVSQSQSNLVVQEIGAPFHNWLVISPAHLWIEIPPGLAVRASLQAGNLAVSGRCQRLSANDQAGAITGVGLVVPVLDLSVQAGSLTVSGARGVQDLTLISQAGNITYAGVLGRRNTVSSQVGSIHLAAFPQYQTVVAASVTLGSLHSTFSSFPGGADGRYVGRIGHGRPGGRLVIHDQVGSVTLSGWHSQ